MRRLEKSPRRRRTSQRNHGGSFEGDAVGNSAGPVGLQDRVWLESAVLVPLGSHAHRVADHPVAFLEAFDAAADSYNFASDVLPETWRVI